MATAPGRRDQRAEPSQPGKPRPPGAAVVGLPGTRSAQSQTSGEGVLVIGKSIEVKGEIGSCRTLVVEGRLEASVQVASLELPESGLFDGSASVDTADIAGTFKGDLTTRGELLLRPTAKVDGKVRYGQIVIEAGGEISGDVAVLPEKERKVGSAG